jgi:hypothetical protein
VRGVQDVTTYVKKFGGEIRVITVACNVKLYAGTSEDTDDLDGQSGDIVTVFKDQENVPMNFHVRNDAEDDDNYVHFDALISNYIDLS